VDAPIHAPEVDDVADQKQMLGGEITQEGDQAIRQAGAGAQMDIRNEHGADGWHKKPMWHSQMTLRLQACNAVARKTRCAAAVTSATQSLAMIPFSPLFSVCVHHQYLSQFSVCSLS
jgi:hypothetical protein